MSRRPKTSRFFCTDHGQHEPYVWEGSSWRDFPSRLLSGDEAQPIRHDRIIWRFNCPMCPGDYRYRISTLHEIITAAGQGTKRPVKPALFKLLPNLGIEALADPGDIDLSMSDLLLTWSRSHRQSSRVSG
jgi:hypothetical protein